MPIFKRKKKSNQPFCSAVVVAAGTSSRMGEDKMMISLGEEPVIIHTIRSLQKSDLICELIIVTREEILPLVAQFCRDYGFNKARKVVRGGATRTQSVYHGIREVSAEAKLIAIHDAARPFPSTTLIDAVIRQAELSGAAAPGLPLKDTIKRANDGMVIQTMDRSELYAVQTPQVFDADLIRGALHKAIEDGAEITDDCAAVERLGMKVVLTPGEEENFKLTTRGDLLLAQSLFNIMGDFS